MLNTGWTCVVVGRVSLKALAPEYWEALEKSETLALNGIGYCKTPFLAIGKDFY